MKSWLFAALLLTGPDLAHEERRLMRGSPLAMLTIVARYQDGTPFRGFISCSGEWFKHSDEETSLTGPSLPFRTDSRGAVILNPHTTDGWIICWATDNGLSGRVTASFEDEPTGVFEIVLGDS